jgi:hypothetical protein
MHNCRHQCLHYDLSLDRSPARTWPIPVENTGATLGDGQPVSDAQPYRGPVVRAPRGPAAAQLGPAGRHLRPVLGGVPDPGPSGLRQRAAVDKALAAQLHQPAPRLLDPHVGREDQVRLFGGGHPVLREHRHSQPVPAARIDVQPVLAACVDVRQAAPTLLSGAASTRQGISRPRPPR